MTHQGGASPLMCLTRRVSALACAPHSNSTSPPSKSGRERSSAFGQAGAVRSRVGFVMYNGRLGMEMLELFIPVKALDDLMLMKQRVGEAVNYR